MSRISPTPRIAFFGTPEFAVYALKSLIGREYPIVAVYTSPDAEIGRKRAISASPVKTLAIASRLPIIQPETLKSDTVFEQFQALSPDLVVVAAYGKIIPQRFLDIPRLGFINIHPSLLPKYRGPTPIPSAILHGERETGVTLMKIDNEVDHGPILIAAPYTLSEDVSYPEAARDLAELGARLLVETLPAYIEGTLVPSPQSHGEATFTHMIHRDDARIQWSQPARHIMNQIRALNPEPGTWTLFEGKTLKVSRAHIIPSPRTTSPGSVSKLNGVLVIETGEDVLAPDTVQLEGGNPIAIRTFLNGHASFLETTLT